jgi:hypothetical protein
MRGYACRGNVFIMPTPDVAMPESTAETAALAGQDTNETAASTPNKAKPTYMGYIAQGKGARHAAAAQRCTVLALLRTAARLLPVHDHLCVLLSVCAHWVVHWLASHHGTCVSVYCRCSCSKEIQLPSASSRQMAQQ